MTHSSAALPEDVYRRIFESSPNAALVRDADGVVLAVNASFEALFGLEAAEVVGRDLRQVVRPAGDGETDGGDWSLGGAAFSRRTRWTAGDRSEEHTSELQSLA